VVFVTGHGDTDTVARIREQVPGRLCAPNQWLMTASQKQLQA
jgi:hypothetical protein